jgi:hypothetical protein
MSLLEPVPWQWSLRLFAGNVWLSFAVEACATIVALMVAVLIGCSWAEGRN